MILVDDRSGLEILERAECLRFLAGEEVGRLALVLGGHPAILPVNYALDGDSIVFRTAAGTKLDAARRGPVAFEIDWFDRGAREGWSVVVHGVAEEVSPADAPEAASRLSRLVLEPWAGGDKPHWIRIRPVSISGRRVRRR